MGGSTIIVTRTVSLCGRGQASSAAIKSIRKGSF